MLLTTQNGIRIQSAVLLQYTFWTDKRTQTDTWDRRQVYAKSAYAVLLTYRIINASLSVNRA